MLEIDDEIQEGAESNGTERNTTAKIVVEKEENYFPQKEINFPQLNGNI